MNPISENTGRCAVIGHGSWATAVVKLLTLTQPVVNWYVRNPEVLESLRTEGHNCRYLSDVEFDMSHLVVSADLNETILNSDFIFLVLPSAFVESYLEPLTVDLKDKVVVSAVKGIPPKQCHTVTEYLRERYQLSPENTVFITGPTHAEEVSHGRLTYITVACTDQEQAAAVGKKLTTNFMLINYTNEVTSLEYAAVLKNIYSVTVGMALGLGYGDNFIAVLVAHCTKEMGRFLRHKALNDQNLPLSCLGDLLVSCYSSHSRNRRLGVLIGHGITVKSALNEMTMIAEGYYASACMSFIDEAHRAQMPIAEMTYQILHKGMYVRKAFKELEKKLM